MFCYEILGIELGEYSVTSTSRNGDQKIQLSAGLRLVVGSVDTASFSLGKNGASS